MHFQLARAYALAATKLTLAIRKQSKEEAVEEDSYFNDSSYGRKSNYIPILSGKSRSKVDQSLFNKSLDEYNLILKKEPNNFIYLLGRGWVYLQLNQIENAKIDFIKIINAVKPIASNDQKINKWDFSALEKYGEIATFDSRKYKVLDEAIEYIIPILKLEKNETLIAKINLIKQDDKYYEGGDAMTPIIFPINSEKSDFENLITPEHYVKFDLDGSGQNNNWQWINKNAAFLVYLGNDKNKLITSGRQFFGNVTFWIFWNNGYEALESLDDNHDGFLSDKELEGIYVWHDINEEGICTPNEIKTLSDFNIKKIAVNHELHRKNIEFNPAGLILNNGNKLPTYDWISSSVETSKIKTK